MSAFTSRKYAHEIAATNEKLSELPAGLRPIAAAKAKNMNMAVGELVAAIRQAERGKLSQKAARETVEAVAEAIHPLLLRKRYSAESAVGPTLQRRLAVKRIRAVLEVYRKNYRTPAVGHGDEVVKLTDQPAAVGVSQSQHLDWNFYAKSYGKPATITDTTIVAPKQWLTRVQKRGLAVLDGMMTLDAAILEGAPEGVELYAAKWIAQSRGYSVDVLTGVIAKAGEVAFHADDMQNALVGLRRKIKAAKWSATLKTAHLTEIFGRLTDAQIDAHRLSVADARAVGACEYGIKSWCAACSLDYAAGSVSLREGWAAYRARPQPEARAALLYALRKIRGAIAA